MADAESAVTLTLDANTYRAYRRVISTTRTSGATDRCLLRSVIVDGEDTGIRGYGGTGVRGRGRGHRHRAQIGATAPMRSRQRHGTLFALYSGNRDSPYRRGSPLGGRKEMTRWHVRP